MIFRPEPPATAELAGHRGDRAEVVVDDVAAIDREHQAVGVGLVGVGLLAQRALLELAAGGDLLVLVLADQAVAGDGLEVADVADGADAPPHALDAEEALQQELVGDVGEDAADVDGGHARLDAPAERGLEHAAAVAERAAGVAVGDRGFEQEFLQAQPALEPLGGDLDCLRGADLLDALELGALKAGRFKDFARHAAIRSVDGRSLGSAGTQDLEFGARGIPVVADGLGFDLAVLAAADLANGCDACGLSERRRANLLGRLLGGDD